MRRPRSRNGTPSAANSASSQPTPAPRINRPPDRFCNVASSLASGSGWRIGNTSTLVPSPNRLGIGRGPGQGQHRVVEQRRRRIRRALRHDDVLAGPDIGKAQFLGLDRGAADRLRPRLAADLRQMNAESHPRSSSKHHCLRCDGGGPKLKRGGPEKETTAASAAPLAAAGCDHACCMRRRDVGCPEGQARPPCGSAPGPILRATPRRPAHYGCDRRAAGRPNCPIALAKRPPGRIARITLPPAPPAEIAPMTEPVPPDNTGNLQAPAVARSVRHPPPGRLNAATVACHYGNNADGT